MWADPEIDFARFGGILAAVLNNKSVINCATSLRIQPAARGMVWFDADYTGNVLVHGIKPTGMRGLERLRRMS